MTDLADIVTKEEAAEVIRLLRELERYPIMDGVGTYMDGTWISIHKADPPIKNNIVISGD